MRARALRLEFAPGARRVLWPGLFMLAGVLALVAVELAQLGDAMSERRRIQTTLADLESRQARIVAIRPPTTKPDPAFLAKVRTAQRVARDLTTPWADLLDSIESAPQQSVALLAVVPSSSKRSIRLTAEARDSAAMLGYLAALQNDSRLNAVVLVSHQLQSQTPGTPIRFQLQAEWGGAK